MENNMNEWRKRKLFLFFVRKTNKTKIQVYSVFTEINICKAIIEWKFRNINKILQSFFFQTKPLIHLLFELSFPF